MKNQPNNKSSESLQLLARASCVCVVALGLMAATGRPLRAEEVSNPKPLDNELKLQFRNIAVVLPVVRSAATLDAHDATNYNSAVRHRQARERADAIFEPVLQPIWLPLYAPEVALAVVSPFGAAAYARGLAKKPSDAEVAKYAELSERERAAVENALATIDPQEILARAFLAAARNQSGRRFRVQLETSPIPAESTSYDAIVENTVQSIHLKRHRKDIYSLVMEISSRVKTPHSSEGLHRDIITYESGTASLSDWASHNAQPLKAQIERACNQVSARLTPQILPRGAPEQRSPERRFAEDRRGLFVTRVNPLNPRHVGRLGNVGIISTCSLPSITMQRPLTKNDAARAVQDSVTDGIRSLENFPSLFSAVALFAAMPVSVAGQTHAGIAGVTEKQLDRADRSLVKTAEEQKLQPILRERLLAHAKSATAHPIFVVAKPFPAGQEKEFSQMSLVMAGTLAWIPDGQTPQYYLHSQNVNTVLEVQIINPVLNGAGEVNPPMRFSAGVRATVWSVEDGIELASCELRHTSAPYHFAAWAKNDGKLLREEIVTFTEGASAAIVQRLGMPAWGVEHPLLAATEAAR